MDNDLETLISLMIAKRLVAEESIPEPTLEHLLLLYELYPNHYTSITILAHEHGMDAQGLAHRLAQSPKTRRRYIIQQQIRGGGARFGRKHRVHTKRPRSTLTAQQMELNTNIWQLREMAACGADRPSKSNPLGKALIRYTSATDSQYREEFNRDIRQLRPDWFILSSDTNKEKLVAWITTNGRRPEQTIRDRDERLMGQLLNNYRRPKAETYDPDFMEMLITKFPFVGITSKQETQNEIIAFITRYGLRPSQTSNDPTERRLAVNMHAYTNQKKRQFDENFAECLADLAPTKSRDDYFNELVTFIEQYGKPRAHHGTRHPTAAQLHERKMFQRIHDYTNPRRQSYCADYAKRLREILIVDFQCPIVGFRRWKNHDCRQKKEK